MALPLYSKKPCQATNCESANLHKWYNSTGLIIMITYSVDLAIGFLAIYTGWQRYYNTFK